MSTCRLVVTSTEQLTPSLLRVWFRSDDLSMLAGSENTDRYVKLVFPKPGVIMPSGLSPRELRDVLAPEDLPVVRTYTARFPDAEAGTMAIDFVVHGDSGIAGPWAQRAQPGDVLDLSGVGGAYRPDPTADVHLLAGDDAAIPALAAALDSLPETAIGQAFVLVDSSAHEPVLPAVPGVKVTFLHRRNGDTLVGAVRDWPWPAGRVQAFVHGEAQEVMHGVRPYLLKERGLPRADASISGYWRHGRTEESFREWKSELAAAEASS